MVLSGIRPSFPSLSRSAGQITHVLLTRSPLEHPHQKMMRAFPFDLHVLSTPPAFVLSQDQTLQKNKQKTKQAKNKEINKTKTNNKHQKTIQCPSMLMFIFKTTKFASSNDTLSSSQTTPPPTTPTPTRRAVNSDHTNIQTPPQNHKPPRHNNKNRDGYHAIPVTLLDLCPCEGFLASPQH